MIQSLVHSVGLSNDQMLLLNNFRGRRNAIDYTGEDVDEDSVEICIEASEQLMKHICDWLVKHRSDLLS